MNYTAAENGTQGTTATPQPAKRQEYINNGTAQTPAARMKSPQVLHNITPATGGIEPVVQQPELPKTLLVEYLQPGNRTAAEPQIAVEVAEQYLRQLPREIASTIGSVVITVHNASLAKADAKETGRQKSAAAEKEGSQPELTKLPEANVKSAQEQQKSATENSAAPHITTQQSPNQAKTSDSEFQRVAPQNKLAEYYTEIVGGNIQSTNDDSPEEMSLPLTPEIATSIKSDSISKAVISTVRFVANTKVGTDNGEIATPEKSPAVARPSQIYNQRKNRKVFDTEAGLVHIVPEEQQGVSAPETRVNTVVQSAMPVIRNTRASAAVTTKFNETYRLPELQAPHDSVRETEEVQDLHYESNATPSISYIVGTSQQEESVAPVSDVQLYPAAEIDLQNSDHPDAATVKNTATLPQPKENRILQINGEISGYQQDAAGSASLSGNEKAEIAPNNSVVPLPLESKQFKGENIRLSSVAAKTSSQYDDSAVAQRTAAVINDAAKALSESLPPNIREFTAARVSPSANNAAAQPAIRNGTTQTVNEHNVVRNHHALRTTRNIAAAVAEPMLPNKESRNTSAARETESSVHSKTNKKIEVMSVAAAGSMSEFAPEHSVEYAPQIPSLAENEQPNSGLRDWQTAVSEPLQKNSATRIGKTQLPAEQSASETQESKTEILNNSLRPDIAAHDVSADEPATALRQKDFGDSLKSDSEHTSVNRKSVPASNEILSETPQVAEQKNSLLNGATMRIPAVAVESDTASIEKQILVAKTTTADDARMTARNTAERQVQNTANEPGVASATLSKTVRGGQTGAKSNVYKNHLANSGKRNGEPQFSQQVAEAEYRIPAENPPRHLRTEAAFPKEENSAAVEAAPVFRIQSAPVEPDIAPVSGMQSAPGEPDIAPVSAEKSSSENNGIASVSGIKSTPVETDFAPVLAEKPSRNNSELAPVSGIKSAPFEPDIVPVFRIKSTPFETEVAPVSAGKSARKNSDIAPVSGIKSTPLETDFAPVLAEKPSRNNSDIAPVLGVKSSSVAAEFAPVFAEKPSRNNSDIAPVLGVKSSSVATKFAPVSAEKPLSENNGIAPVLGVKSSSVATEFAPVSAEKPLSENNGIAPVLGVKSSSVATEFAPVSAEKPLSENNGIAPVLGVKSSSVATEFAPVSAEKPLSENNGIAPVLGVKSSSVATEFATISEENSSSKNSDIAPVLGIKSAPVETEIASVSRIKSAPAETGIAPVFAEKPSRNNSDIAPVLGIKSAPVETEIASVFRIKSASDETDISPVVAEKKSPENSDIRSVLGGKSASDETDISPVLEEKVAPKNSGIASDLGEKSASLETDISPVIAEKSSWKKSDIAPVLVEKSARNISDNARFSVGKVSPSNNDITPVSTEKPAPRNSGIAPVFAEKSDSDNADFAPIPAAAFAIDNGREKSGQILQQAAHTAANSSASEIHRRKQYNRQEPFLQPEAIAEDTISDVPRASAVGQPSEQQADNSGNGNSADRQPENLATKTFNSLKEEVLAAENHGEKQKKTTPVENTFSAALEKSNPMQEQSAFFMPFGAPVMRGMKKTTGVREYHNVDIAKTSDYVMRLAGGAPSGSRSSAVLHLRPEELGGITLSVSVQGNSVGVTISVETNEAQQAVVAQLSSLRDQLTKNGMTVTTIEVLPPQQDTGRQAAGEHSWQSSGNSREEQGQRQAYLRSFRAAAERRESISTPDRTTIIRKTAANGSIEHYI